MANLNNKSAHTRAQSSKLSQLQNIGVCLQANELAQLDEWRSLQKRPLSRPDAIKQLVAIALQLERAPKLLDELREWAQAGGPTNEEEITESIDHFIELVLKKYGRFSAQKKRWAKIYLIGHANQISGPAGLNQYYNYVKDKLLERGLIYKTNRGRPVFY